MNERIGWALAAAATAAGFWVYGWRGVLLALSVVVFWLLLQFSRSLRVLKNAGSAPVGHVDSAVMLHSRLKAGMTLMQVVTLTRSLGQGVDVGEKPERWAWADASGARVELSLANGKLVEWQLLRNDGPAQERAQERPT
ncbi:MAG: hypothetical protein ABIR94_12255 [Rubrivivax sp.]